MSFLRPLLMVAVVAIACFLSTTWSQHHEVSNADPFTGLYGHVVPVPLVHHHDEDPDAATDDHAIDPLVAFTLPGWPLRLDGDGDEENGPTIVMSNLQIFQLAALLLILIGFSGVPSYLRTGRGDVISCLLAGFCLYIRDEMVYPAMGKELGAKFLPFFLFIFFFILAQNLMGLAPFSATATASIFVTAALALITLGAMLGCGMVAQGPVKFWTSLVPHVPLALWPLMFIVEVLGLFVKPFALMIRLFANLTGGHLVVLSFMGLIFMFAGVESSAMGYAVAPMGVGFAVFIMIIEAFVAMLQAYIFTQLSIMFVGASVHPEH